MSLLIAPHKDAPLLSNPKEAPTILQQAIQEVEGGRYTSQEVVRDLFRQAALVNQWFCLKYIAGYSGPFEKLNTDLNLDMCNFGHLMLEKGSMNAVAMPRKHRKSTIFTSGHSIWVLLRDPDESICIFSGVFDRSMDFLHTVQRFFDSNELAAWLFPEFMGAQINDKQMILPNRSRWFTEPSIRCGTVGGASEGQHFSRIKIDDPVGLEQLDSMRRSNADMLKRRDWLLSSRRTLLRDWTTGCVDVCFTRYAVDDAYEPIMQNIKEKHGFWGGVDYPVKDDGEWRVYYRMVQEDGKIIFPEAITAEGLKKLAEEDPWTLITQYENNPQATGLAELNEYDPKECFMTHDEEQGWLILFGPDDVVPLSACDVVQAGDPAGTERYVNARTSRSAVVSLARDPKDRKVLIEIRAGYVPPETFFDWLFQGMKKFNNYLRKTLFEAQGPFRALYNLLVNEQNRRSEYLHLDKVTAIGDKDARIRNLLQPELERGLIWVVSDYMQLFNGEMKVFPQSQKKDILDATAIAIAGSTRPYDQDESKALREKEDAWIQRPVGAAGY